MRIRINLSFVVNYRRFLGLIPIICTCQYPLDSLSLSLVRLKENEESFENNIRLGLKIRLSHESQKNELKQA